MNTPSPWRQVVPPLDGKTEIPVGLREILDSLAQSDRSPTLYVTDRDAWTILTAWNSIKNSPRFRVPDVEPSFPDAKDSIALVSVPVDGMDQLTAILDHLASIDAARIPKWWAIETPSSSDVDWMDRIHQLLRVATHLCEIHTVADAHPCSRFVVFELMVESPRHFLHLNAPTKLGEEPGHLEKRADWFQRREKDAQ